jgi:hypothetical protein
MPSSDHVPLAAVVRVVTVAPVSGIDAFTPPMVTTAPSTGLPLSITRPWMS